jgi:protein subunit release factor A
MPANKPKPWRLDPSDVLVDRSWMRASGRGGNIARTSRAVGTQEGRIRLTHAPTKIQVDGVVPEGEFTRKEMSAAMNLLHAELFAKLEKLVAKHMRLAGR